MKVTLSKALKLKARLLDSMNESHSIFVNSNVFSSDAPADYDAVVYLEKYKRQVEQLVKLKTAITKANNVELILNLAETKTLLTRVKRMESTKSNRTIRDALDGEKKVEYQVRISTVERDQFAKELKERIADMQDELDTYNALTEIEIPDLEF